MANFKFLETEYQLKKLKPKYNNFWYAGKLKGYWCIVSANFYEKKCSITIGAHKDDTHKSLIDILKDESSLRKAKITTEDATVTISYKIPFFTSSNRKKFDEIIETVISNLKRNDFSTGGFLDGTNDSTLSIVEVGQKYFYLTDSEYKKKSEDLELKNIYFSDSAVYYEFNKKDLSEGFMQALQMVTEEIMGISEINFI